MARLRILAAAAVLALALAGCSGHENERGRGDAPVTGRDDEPAYVLNMPDQFANVAMKCLGPNGVYSTTREAAVTVVVDDPNCAEGTEVGG